MNKIQEKLLKNLKESMDMEGVRVETFPSQPNSVSLYKDKEDELLSVVKRKEFLDGTEYESRTYLGLSFRGVSSNPSDAVRMMFEVMEVYYKREVQNIQQTLTRFNQ